MGAVSVHGVCGAWGVLSVGLFARYDDAFLGREKAGLFYGGGFDQLAMQARDGPRHHCVGVATSTIMFFVLKKTIGLRVTAEEEIEGLDFLEHGIEGYADRCQLCVTPAAPSPASVDLSDRSERDQT